MKVSTEPVENSQVVLNLEMGTAEVDESLGVAYNRLVKKVSIPGFRKGKAPRDVLERHIGKDALLQEALEHLIPKAYNEAIESNDIDAIAQPEIEIIQTEPLILKATVPVRPTVNLNDYKGIRIEPIPVEVSDEDEEKAIDQLRHQHAILSPVDRPSQFGDTVVMSIWDKTQGESVLIREDLEYEINKDAKLPLPGFAEKLEGMVKGEEKSFVLSYPDDYEVKELAGKEYSFEVKVTEIKEEQLPEVDDEFARNLGSDDLTSLREKIAADLKTKAEERARLGFQQKAVDATVDLSDVEYPSVLADREIDQLLNEEAGNFVDGIKGLENYLRSINKTLEDHREELRVIADQRIVRSLVLEKVAEAEGIEVSASEIDDEIEKMTKDADQQSEKMREFFRSPQARKSIEQMLLSRKTVEHLAQIASRSD